PTLELPEAADQAHGGLVRLGARARQEGDLEARRRQLRQGSRQLDRDGRCLPEEGLRVGKLAHLPRGRLGGVAAPLAEHDAPHAREAVDQASPLGVPNVDALGARDQQRAVLSQPLRIGEAVQVMDAVEALPLPGVARRGADRAHAGLRVTVPGAVWHGAARGGSGARAQLAAEPAVNSWWDAPAPGPAC